MHINTLWNSELRRSGAWPLFAALEWKTRHQALGILYALAVQALIETDGLVERAGQEIASITGSPLLGEAARRSLAKWVAP